MAGQGLCRLKLGAVKIEELAALIFGRGHDVLKVGGCRLLRVGACRPDLAIFLQRAER